MKSIPTPPKSKPGAKLTAKQKAFADTYLKDKKKSPTKAVMETYNAKNRHVARQIARENLHKPAIMSYLQLHSTKAEETVVEVMDYAKQQMDKPTYARIALDSANSVLDRTIGKPQQHDTTTRIDNLTINFGSPKPQTEVIEGEIA